MINIKKEKNSLNKKFYKREIQSPRKVTPNVKLGSSETDVNVEDLRKWYYIRVYNNLPFISAHLIQTVPFARECKFFFKYRLLLKSSNSAKMNDIFGIVQEVRERGEGETLSFFVKLLHIFFIILQCNFPFRGRCIYIFNNLLKASFIIILCPKLVWFFLKIYGSHSNANGHVCGKKKSSKILRCIIYMT